MPRRSNITSHQYSHLYPDIFFHSARTTTSRWWSRTSTLHFTFTSAPDANLRAHLSRDTHNPSLTSWTTPLVPYLLPALIFARPYLPLASTSDRLHTRTPFSPPLTLPVSTSALSHYHFPFLAHDCKTRVRRFPLFPIVPRNIFHPVLALVAYRHTFVLAPSITCICSPLALKVRDPEARV
jgi:hypothetical protein